jgi:hypothetical protein
MGELEKSVPSRATIFLEAEKQGRCLRYHGYLRANAANCTAACILMPMSGSVFADNQGHISRGFAMVARDRGWAKSQKQNSEVEGLRLDVELRRRGLVTRRNALGNEGKIIGMLDQDAALGVQLVGVPIGINRNTF